MEISVQGVGLCVVGFTLRFVTLLISRYIPMVHGLTMDSERVARGSTSFEVYLHYYPYTSIV